MVFDWQKLKAYAPPNSGLKILNLRCLKRVDEDYVVMSMEDVIKGRDELLETLSQKYDVGRVQARVLAVDGWKTVAADKFTTTFLEEYYTPHVKSAQDFDEIYQTVFHIEVKNKA